MSVSIRIVYGDKYTKKKKEMTAEQEEKEMKKEKKQSPNCYDPVRAAGHLLRDSA